MAASSRRTLRPAPSKFDPAAALAVLRDEFARDAETPEPGYLTARQWAKEWGMSREHALHTLTSGIARGLVQEKYYRVKVSTYLRKVRHFKVAPKS